MNLFVIIIISNLVMTTIIKFVDHSIHFLKIKHKQAPNSLMK